MITLTFYVIKIIKLSHFNLHMTFLSVLLVAANDNY